MYLSEINVCNFSSDETAERLFLTSVYVCCSFLISLDSVCFLFHSFLTHSVFLYTLKKMFGNNLAPSDRTLLSEGQVDICEKVHLSMLLRVLLMEIIYFKKKTYLSAN